MKAMSKDFKGLMRYRWHKIYLFLLLVDIPFPTLDISVLLTPPHIVTPASHRRDFSLNESEAYGLQYDQQLQLEWKFLCKESKTFRSKLAAPCTCTVRVGNVHHIRVFGLPMFGNRLQIMGRRQVAKHSITRNAPIGINNRYFFLLCSQTASWWRPGECWLTLHRALGSSLLQSGVTFP